MVIWPRQISSNYPGVTCGVTLQEARGLGFVGRGGRTTSARNAPATVCRAWVGYRARRSYLIGVTRIPAELERYSEGTKAADCKPGSFALRAVEAISGAKVRIAGTYNRAAYAAQKKAALERWAAHVEGVTDRRGEIVDLHNAWKV
jgi:hypothetical protein